MPAFCLLNLCEHTQCETYTVRGTLWGRVPPGPPAFYNLGENMEADILLFTLSLPLQEIRLFEKRQKTTIRILREDLISLIC